MLVPTKALGGRLPRQQVHAVVAGAALLRPDRSLIAKDDTDDVIVAGGTYLPDAFNRRIKVGLRTHEEGGVAIELLHHGTTVGLHDPTTVGWVSFPGPVIE